MKMQINISTLEEILRQAKKTQESDLSLSNTLEFEVKKESETHTGQDEIKVMLKSSYSDCVGCMIY